jgi:hypothetical protein
MRTGPGTPPPVPVPLDVVAGLKPPVPLPVRPVPLPEGLPPPDEVPSVAALPSAEQLMKTLAAITTAAHPRIQPSFLTVTSREFETEQTGMFKRTGQTI